MKIAITRTTVGRLLGMLILATIALLFSYLATAWIWWELNPGAWSEGARATQLLLSVALLFLRWLGGAVTIVPDTTGEE